MHQLVGPLSFLIHQHTNNETDLREPEHCLEFFEKFNAVRDDERELDNKLTAPIVIREISKSISNSQSVEVMNRSKQSIDASPVATLTKRSSNHMSLERVFLSNKLNFIRRLCKWAVDPKKILSEASIPIQASVQNQDCQRVIGGAIRTSR